MEEQNKLKENETMKQLKEMEIAKLREKQRKLYDNKNIIKEIMDKRAFEEGERLERKKIKEEYTKIQKLKENMKLENEKLLDFKKKIKLEEANKNDREYADNAKKSLEEIEKEKEYRQDLKKMIIEKEENKKLQKKEIFDEGKKIKLYQEEYYKKLQNIKSRKIEELKKLNVPQNYIRDLEKF